jgi:hypothetical protein
VAIGLKLLMVFWAALDAARARADRQIPPASFNGSMDPPLEEK